MSEDPLVTLKNCKVEGCVAVLVLHICISLRVGQQVREDLLVTLKGCKLEGCVVLLVHHIWISVWNWFNPNTDPNVRNQEGDTPIMILLKSNLNIDIQGNCLQAFVDCNKVDLDVKDPDGDGLEDLARKTKIDSK